MSKDLRDSGRDVSGQAFPSGCYAPFTSLHLDPRGHVRACCMNEWHSLGVIPERTLGEIWRGSEVSRLRDHLRADDFSLGCERCAMSIEAGSPDAAYRRVFDGLTAETVEPEWPRQLELALSNTCNLQCVMCNGDLSSAIRSQREGRPALPSAYGEDFFDELRMFLPHVESVVFLGGEPFLARETMRVFDLLDELSVHPRCHVTTNGMQWNDRVRSIVESHRIHIAVSVDALSVDLAESIRVGADHERVLANVEEIRGATAAEGKGCSIAFSLMRTNWQELGAMLSWADQRDMDVFVNEVMYPTAMSLRHLPRDQLVEIRDTLLAESADRSRELKRNLGVWRREIQRVGAVVGERTSGLEVAPSRDETPSPVALRSRSPVGLDAPEGWERAALVVDAEQIVRSVRGADLVAGMRLRSLEGRPLRELVDVLAEGLGPIQASHVAVRPDGTEVRDLVFGDGERRTALRASQTTDSGGERWELAIEPVTHAHPRT